MYALATFDKTFEHFRFESKVYYIWLKSKMAFDSRQKLSTVWSNNFSETFKIYQRHGAAKVIFRVVYKLP